jgi:epoxyqueuosine reductase
LFNSIVLAISRKVPIITVYMADNITTEWVIEKALEQGFVTAGIVSVQPMDAAPLRTWLSTGYNADMSFLHRHAALRENAALLLNGARSVICAAMPYPTPDSTEPLYPGIARYARGADYHKIAGDKLRCLWEDIIGRQPGSQGRVFVDSGPLPEREYARRAGLGWIGRHGCIIHPDAGSRIILGEIVTTLELVPTEAISGDCGNCTRCISACPTGALIAPGIVDARRCLSYLTIENPGPIPPEYRVKVGTRLFGCDSCQDVCPYNTVDADKQAPVSTDDICDLFALSAQDFIRRFLGKAIMRAKRSGLLRNACVVLGNLGDDSALPVLKLARDTEDELIREHAEWAIEQIAGKLEIDQQPLSG